MFLCVMSIKCTRIILKFLFISVHLKKLSTLENFDRHCSYMTFALGNLQIAHLSKKLRKRYNRWNHGNIMDYFRNKLMDVLSLGHNIVGKCAKFQFRTLGKWMCFRILKGF